MKIDKEKFIQGLSVISGVFGVLGYINVLPSRPLSVILAHFFFVLFCICIISLLYSRLYRILSHIHPWVGFGTMIVVVFIYANTNYRKIMINLDSGGLYPTYADEENKVVCLSAWGFHDWDRIWF